MLISPIRAFDDNYIWAIQPAKGKPAVIVDPGDEKPVLAWLEKHNVQLASILITHHHWDHTDGLMPLLEHYQVPVYGPANPKIEGITHPVAEGNTFVPEGLQSRFEVIETPGHTLDHISFYTPGLLFCGDTLFSAGCGRMFEGTAPQFYTSLRKLAELPATTAVYCTHEYTAANLRFAAAAEPDNKAIEQAQRDVAARREDDQPSLPSSIARELEINPFLHARDPDEFARLRQWKDKF
ncbi:hydroxyacylglutathione hydrolase [Pseudidiomarina terrestris]|uniref:Hydroxyacylglutathione hydrolase n=1 Tax=Pseudidiomarina terrestris TaxID=2820060 RepID=A0AAW7QXY6_9GAMM|nr:MULTISPECIES: hydroxyacylglutathione hydrolase [unclassified Pseudidiomarina]MDN7123909.1 hydroxyacylglutathione hydrolase [Pseudidiomarina sp. 1APP75-32.1]MDN7127663.1 hydroxyacylglutathione hydrolase [Pseudidiomarina sp. 1APR75-33.1]MDN7130409.1 hydroxyacylglutathione hydrolase [Pseudidiomarina sp. 1APR75-15]MDN7136332.1 hydroxyacylglutathione hydrolase [Pseudidiomarina sp. 1ASP75-5]MDN7138751.1 hydroxyacylglutathione hydrolase [Pseudidiomarina sp. 1ASP75-14]